ncbi:hypothetical protein A4F85_04720 [Delftia sp. GW456-R20]|nr:hypothetical protein A4F85_04720 [Delftia sp. GW456-R20]
MSTDRFVFPLAVGCRIFWAEDYDNGMRLLELDCVADDFGNLVGVPHDSAATVARDAQGWSYRTAETGAAA